MNYRYVTEEIKTQAIEDAHLLHCNPELSHQEYKTTEFILNVLKSLDIELPEMQPTTGVVGLLRGGKTGPTVVLRADIDALPVEESPDHTIRSQNPGKMHACGHDFHTAALLGAARALCEHKQNIPGNVLFVFQPAEESTTGAVEVIKTSVFKKYPPVAFVALHVMPDMPAGKVGVREGPLMAAQFCFSVDIQGKGGHGATPHTTRDPLIAAVHVTEGLQSIASRWANPIEPFAFSVCSLHSGTACNIIPDTARLEGTCRFLNESYEKEASRQVVQIANAAAQMHGCSAKVDFFHETPVTLNDPKLAVPARKAAAAVFGEENLFIQDLCIGSEDFSYYKNIAPAFMYHVGIGATDGSSAKLHNPKMLVPDETAAQCAELLTQAALTVLAEQ